MKKKYKDIEGHVTPWLGKHKSLLKRLIRKVYIKYVNEPYIPEPTKVKLVLKQGSKNEIKYISFQHKVKGYYGYIEEYYIFNDFGNDFPKLER